MNADLLSILLLLLYCGLLVAGAVQDVAKLRISNWISVATLAVAAVALVVSGGPGWWEHPLSFALMLGLGIGLFALGWFGGGDAKLMAAAAMAFDLGGLIRLIISIFMIGGLVSIATLAVRMMVGGKGELRERRSVPYGVAIAAGAIVAALVFPYFTVFAPGEPNAGLEFIKGLERP